MSTSSSPRSVHLHVVHGDIAQLQADALVFGTNHAQTRSGMLYRSLSKLPAFVERYVEGEGRRPFDGDRAYWMSLSQDPKRQEGPEPRKIQGVVVAEVLGAGDEVAHADQIEAVVNSSIETALREVTPHGGEILLAMPALGAGRGGGALLNSLAQAQVKACAEALMRWREGSGTPGVNALDVVLVGYHHAAFLRLIAARRSVRASMGDLWPNLAPGGEVLGSLARAISTQECVLFVGSGLSYGAGLPSWSQLIDRLLLDLPEEVQAEYRAEGAKAGASRWRALSADDYLDIASWHWLACQEGARDETEDLTHQRYIRELFSDQTTADIPPALAHYQLMTLPWRYVVTTNYDVMLERTLSAQRKETQLVVTEDEISRAGSAGMTTVIKFHGHAADPDEDDARDRAIVLTRDEYEGFFHNHQAKALLLESLLLNHHFFFYGYSLRDLDLRLIYSRVGSLLSEKRRSAFALTLERGHPLSRRYWSQRGLQLEEVHSPLWLSRRLDGLLDASTRLGFPFLADRKAPAHLPELESAHEAALGMADALERVVFGPLFAERSDLAEKALNAIEPLLDALSQSGWRPSVEGGWTSIWRQLAGAVPPKVSKRLLEKAASFALSASALEEVAGAIRELEEPK